MTKEEAWLVWIRATKTSNLPVETDFDIIKRTSWWAAFEAGWNAAAVNLNGWDDAYMMGVQAGKEVQKANWVGLTDEEIHDYADKFLYQHGSNYGIKSFGKAIEAKLKEKNT